MKLSVCMIVKNEQDVLERCLKCAKQVADEIIIVDTGSIDKTKSIAQKYTDKIFDFVWCNDFSKARNFAFEKATCEYIMWLDADDIISKKNIQKIKKIKEKIENVDIVMAKYSICFDCCGNPTYSYFRERIVRRGKFFWQGFVHEVIVPSGKIIYEDFEIWHKKTSESNPRRNLNIYLAHKKQGDVFDARSQYYFAKEYFYLQKYKSAVTNLCKFLKMKNKYLPNQIDAMYTLAKCFMALNKSQKALDVLFDILKNFFVSSEVLCLIGQIFCQQQQYERAKQFYLFATTIKPNFEFGNFVDLDFYYFVPYLQLVWLYYHTNDLKSACYFQKKLEKLYPQREQVVFNKRFFDQLKQ